MSSSSIVTVVGKNQDGVYSQKRLAGKPRGNSFSLNSPVQKYYHTSLSASNTPGYFNETVAGRYWNEVAQEKYDDGYEVIGQELVESTNISTKKAGLFLDEFDQGIVSGSDCKTVSFFDNVVDLQNEYLHPFSIYNLDERDQILFDGSSGTLTQKRGISADSQAGFRDSADIAFTRQDANKNGIGEERGFFRDSFNYKTSSLYEVGVPKEVYNKDGSVSMLGYFNDSKFNYVSGSSTKTLQQENIVAFSHSSPFIQAGQNITREIIGLDEENINHVSNKWHFISSGSRTSGDNQKLSGSSRFLWTARYSPFDTLQYNDANCNMNPPIRRQIQYSIKDEYNYKNNVKTAVTGTNAEYEHRHINYKDIAADQKEYTIGVDSFTTMNNEQLLSPTLNEAIGDELYERNIHKFLDSFKTLHFKVSSSLTPHIKNEFQIGVHPLQNNRPTKMVKFPKTSHITFVDNPNELPIDPMGIHDIDPLEGDSVFEPGRKQLPRIFVPEHYITGALGGSGPEVDENMTTYNPEWAADPKGGKVLSHWEEHSVLFDVVDDVFYATSSFYNYPNAWSDVELNGLIGTKLFPSIMPMSEINDYWYRNGEKYSIAHKQTYSGSIDWLRYVNVGQLSPESAGNVNFGVVSAYQFSASITFYSCSGGVIADSITFGPYISAPFNMHECYIRLSNTGTLPSDDYFYGQLPSGLDRGADGATQYNYIWSHGADHHYVEYDDSFGYLREGGDVTVDQYTSLGLSTASIRYEAVLLTGSNDAIRDIDLLLYNTSSIKIDFIDTFDEVNFLKNSLDRNVENANLYKVQNRETGYKNLYNSVVDRSNFDNSISPIRTNMTYYGFGVRSGRSDTGVSMAMAFLGCKNRGDAKGFSDNYGDVTNYPNAMVVPGVRPFREDRNLFDAKNDTLTYGKLYNNDHYSVGSLDFFIAGARIDLDEEYAKTQNDADLCKINDYTSNAYWQVDDKNITGIGIEGFYGFKNYIRQEGSAHNQCFFDAILVDKVKNNIFSFTDFYALTENNVYDLEYMARNNISKFFMSFIHNSTGDMNFVSKKRIPPDFYSEFNHTIFLQYPKSYATASSISAISAVTYSFERGGSILDYNRIGIDGITDFNNTAITTYLSSESFCARSELAIDNRNSIAFKNKDSNFIFVHDDSSTMAQETGLSCVQPKSTYQNLLTNSFGDLTARASLTDKRRWSLNKTNLVDVGDGDYEINISSSWTINRAQIGNAVSASVVSQYGTVAVPAAGDLEGYTGTSDDYDIAVGTMGYFKNTSGPNISDGVTGSITRRTIENSFVDFTVDSQFDWVAEQNMVASQVNFWAGSTRINSITSQTTGVAGPYTYYDDGTYYPGIANIDNYHNNDYYIKHDGFVNLPIIVVSFVNTVPDNGIYTPGIHGEISTANGEHMSCSLLSKNTGSFAVGVSYDAQVLTMWLRKFKYKQYEKTKAGFGDDDYIRRVNEKLLHKLGRSYMTGSNDGPDFAITTDIGKMLIDNNGERNIVLIDNALLKDAAAGQTNLFWFSGSSVMHDKIGSMDASSSFFYQMHNKSSYFNTNYGQNSHLIQQRYTANEWGKDSEYVVAVTPSGNVVYSPLGVLPWASDMYPSGSSEASLNPWEYVSQ